MRCVRHLAMLVAAILLTSEVCRADTFAYIECWASGTLTTGEAFESWRIHVVIPEEDDWRGSEADAWLAGGPTWYYNWDAGFVPEDPDVFLSFPDAEFATFVTSPHLYPNSTNEGELVRAEALHDPTHLFEGWVDLYIDPPGDYVVFQGTVLNPVAGPYGTIDFWYGTALEPDAHAYTFVIPEPTTGALLALGACTLLRRQRCRARARSSPHA